MVVGSTIVYIILYFRSTHSRMEREKMREMFVSLLGSADKQGQLFFWEIIESQLPPRKLDFDKKGFFFLEF